MNKRPNLVLRIPNPQNDIDEIQNISQPAADESGEKEALFVRDEPGIFFDPGKKDFYKVLAVKQYVARAVMLTSEITSLILELY